MSTWDLKRVLASRITSSPRQVFLVLDLLCLGNLTYKTTWLLVHISLIHFSLHLNSSPKFETALYLRLGVSLCRWLTDYIISFIYQKIVRISNFSSSRVASTDRDFNTGIIRLSKHVSKMPLLSVESKKKIQKPQCSTLQQQNQ